MRLGRSKPNSKSLASPAPWRFSLLRRWSARRLAARAGRADFGDGSLELDRVQDAGVDGAFASSLVTHDEALGALHDGGRHVDAARPLDPFEPGRAVDLEDLRPARSLEHVDARHLEPHGARRGDGGRRVAPI